jgi:SPP1 family predicted phage head-tail adaptor
MRFRVRIEAPSTTQGPSGQPLDQWSLYAERFAAVVPTAGSERFAAQQQFARTPTTWKLRHLEGVNPSMRLVFKGRVYDIVSVVDPDETRRELILTTLERVGEPA